VIPHLEAFLKMHERGDMPMAEIAAHIVKYVAGEGSKADFDGLSAQLRHEVVEKIKWYRREGGWLIISNNGVENYAPYAESFLEKVGGNIA
jgi:hypothetical protein